MAVAVSSYKLNVFCRKHPDYRGIKDSRACATCHFIYAIRHGSEVVNLVIEPEDAPSRLRFTRQRKEHQLGCPKHSSNVKLIRKIPTLSKDCNCCHP